jgi:hypothetical protein
MRVLLPLRKVPANNHDSSSSLEEEEAAAAAAAVGQQEATVIATPVGPGSLVPAVGLDLDHLGCYSAETAAAESCSVDVGDEGQGLGSSAAQAFSRAALISRKQKEARKAAWDDETGLRKSLVESLKEIASRKGSHSVYRKRKASVEIGDSSSKACKKRPALVDRKPPARDLSSSNNNNNMVGGSRRRVYAYGDSSDDSIRQTSTDLEDDPVENDPLENNPASARGDPLNDDVDFALALKKRGLELRLQEGDGNCLFRAVSLQVYGDPSMHNDVRQQCLDFMVSYDYLFATYSTVHH